jgi:hypothetical protein
VDFSLFKSIVYQSVVDLQDGVIFNDEFMQGIQDMDLVFLGTNY